MEKVSVQAVSFKKVISLFILVLFLSLLTFLFLPERAQEQSIIFLNLQQAQSRAWGVIIDARNEKKYKKISVYKSINIPGRNIEEMYLQYKKVLKRKEPSGILIFCSPKPCVLSKLVADYLSQKGYKNLYILEEGISENAMFNKTDLFEIK